MNTKLLNTFILNLFICLVIAKSPNVISTVKYLGYDSFRSHNLLESNASSQCSYHMKYYHQSLQDGKYWALRMFDSSTKYAESILMGLTTHLGNFDECIGVENITSELGSFDGKHCLITFLVPDAIISQRREILSVYDNPILGGEKWKFNTKKNEIPLRMSYCVPSSCTSKDIELFLSDHLKRVLPKSKISVVVPDVYCHTNQSSTCDTGCWVMVAFLVILGIIVISSTAVEYFGIGQNYKLLVVFSLKSNWKKLTNMETSGNRIHAIDGMRYMHMLWIILCHSWSYSIALPSSNFITVQEELRGPHSMFITNGTLSADTFLFLSGFLVAYLYFKQKTEGKTFNIVNYYLHRYIRLVPAYLFVILIEATLLKHLVTGPLSTATVNNMEQNCRRNWWTNLLFINNYVDAEHMCLSQSWYLAIDMQLFLLSPALLYALSKCSIKRSGILIKSLIICGILIPFLISLIQSFPANILFGREDQQELWKQLYYATYARFGPWVIGLGLGCIQHGSTKENIKLSKKKVFFSMLLLKILIMASVEAGYFFYMPGNMKAYWENAEYSDIFDKIKANFGNAAYNGVFRTLWTMGIGLTLFMCMNGQAAGMNRFYSSKLFKPLSRLVYCIYLTHPSLKTIMALSTRTPFYSANVTVIPLIFGDLMMCLFPAMMLYLFVESPVKRIQKIIVGSEKQSSANSNQNKEAGTSMEME